MAQLIWTIAGIVLVAWLGAQALVVAVTAVPSLAAGVTVGGVVLLLIYGAKVWKVTSPENFERVVSFYLDGSRVDWRLSEDGDSSRKRLYPEVVVACLLGAASTQYLGPRLHLVDTDPVYQSLARVVSLVAVPWCIARARPRRVYNACLRRRVSLIMGRLNSTLSGLDELRELQVSLRRLAGKIGIEFSADYVTEVEKHVTSHQHELVFDTLAFRALFEARLRAARKDLEELQRGVGTLEEMQQLYIQTAREVNRTESISLITECDSLGAGMLPDNLPTLLTSRKWAEFAEAALLMRTEMTELQGRARRYRQERDASERIYPAPSQLSTEEALQILGVGRGAPWLTIKGAYRQAVRKYNVDQRQELEPHIRELVEERHRALNLAYALLEAEFGHK